MTDFSSRLMPIAALFSLAITASLALTATPAAAQMLDDPRAVAMSGVRGDPIANGAVYHNPAGMSRAYLYAAEAIFLRDSAGNNVAAVNIVDSKTQQKLAVGASYGFQFSDSDAAVRTDGHDARLALSHSVSERVHVGIGLRYLHLDREADGGVVVEDLKGFTLDGGLFVDVGSGLFLGVSGENLIDLDDAAAPRQLGGAVGFTGSTFSVDVDVMADFDRQAEGETAVVVGAGLELLLADVVPLRVGYTWDGALEQSWVGGGVGFITKGAGSNGGQVSVSYRQNVTVSGAYVFAAGLTLFL